MTKSKYENALFDAEYEINRIKSEFMTQKSPLPDQRSLIKHIHALCSIAKEATSKLISSGQPGKEMVTYSNDAYCALLQITVATRVLAEVSGVVSKPPPVRQPKI